MRRMLRLAIDGGNMAINAPVLPADTHASAAPSFTRLTATVTSGSRSPAWWRIRNADLAIALLAIPLLIEASLRGQETVRSAVAGADPIGLALPIVGLAGLAVVELRLAHQSQAPAGAWSRSWTNSVTLVRKPSRTSGRT